MARVRAAVEEYIPGVLCGVCSEEEILEAVECSAELLGPEGFEELLVLDGLPVRASDYEMREAVEYAG